MPTSRRLSSQEIDSDDGWENCELLYPDSDPETSVSSSPQAPPSSSIVPPAAAAPRRKSHARQRSATHIPRPPNPFICFRSDYCVWNKQLDSGGVRNHRLVSKLAGEAWRALDIASRQKYEELAQEKKKEHRIRYPDYAYAPTPASRLGGKGKKRRADDDCDYEDRPLPSKRRRSRGLQLAVDTDAHVFDSLPSPTNTTWKPNGPARSPAPSPELERPQTPELSPNSSSESPNPDPSDFLRTPPVASYPELEDDDGDFVATADIPPLDLYANAPEQKKDRKADHSLQPTFCNPLHHSSTQFFKAEIPKQARELCMWYNADGTYNALADSSTSYPADVVNSKLPPINYSAVQLTNPFQLKMEDLFHMDQLQ